MARPVPAGPARPDASRRRVRHVLAFALLGCLLLAGAVLGVAVGSVPLTPPEVWGALTGTGGDETVARIAWNIRMPRVAAAVLLGGALSVAGFLLQTFFNNPIAGPFVLGISSGAKLAVALVMVASLAAGLTLGSVAMIGAAFVGALASMAFVMAVSRRVRRSSTLIICGIMIGYICSGVTDFVVTFADDSNIVNLHNWSLGSFSGTSWDNVAVMAAVVGVAVLASFLLSKSIAAYQMGEVYARSVGVDIRRFRGALIVLSSVLSACVTAFAGPVSFVGIAVPHLVKALLGTARPILVIPACFLGGGVFCLVCDLVARCAFSPVELNISSVTAVFGAPVVIYMMMRRRRGEGS